MSDNSHSDRSHSDRVVRSITDDGTFRMIATRTDATVREAVRVQGVEGAVASVYGELLTAAILYRETMAPKLRVQAIMNGPGKQGRLIADSRPDGGIRGLVSLPPGVSTVELGTGWLLRMSRQLPGGRLHEGVVEFPHDGGLAQALMSYMQRSEQVTSVIAVGTADGPDGLRAGGYLVQLLPEIDRETLAIVIARLDQFPPMAGLLTENATCEQLTQAVFGDLKHTILESTEVRFNCPCSHERAALALTTAAKQEVLDAIAEDRVLETKCDFCNVPYRFEPADLLLPKVVAWRDDFRK